MKLKKFAPLEVKSLNVKQPPKGGLSPTGFTLLEAIIVLAIMTMFFAVSLPVFSRFMENAKLEMGARSVVSALRTARGYAITNNTVYYVFFVTIDNKPSYYISSSDEAVPAAPVDVVDKVYKLPAGILFNPLTGFTGSRAVFKSTGEVDAAGTVTIKDSRGNVTTVSVEKTTGRARSD